MLNLLVSLFLISFIVGVGFALGVYIVLWFIDVCNQLDERFKRWFYAWRCNRRMRDPRG